MSTKPIPKGPLEIALGQRFRVTRERQKVTLKDLARELDVSVNMIRWHEAGDRMMRAEVLLKAAQIMGVPAGELMEIPTESEQQNAVQESV